MNNTADKLNMYKAVETVCASNHTEWNGLPQFGSAFSKFAVKVAQLDLLTDDDSPAAMIKPVSNSGHAGERIRKLMYEIDILLSNSIDSLVRFLRQEHNEFYSMYVSARERC